MEKGKLYDLIAFFKGLRREELVSCTKRGVNNYLKSSERICYMQCFVNGFRVIYDILIDAKGN